MLNSGQCPSCGKEMNCKYTNKLQEHCKDKWHRKYDIKEEQHGDACNDYCEYWDSCKYYEDGEYCYYCNGGEYYKDLNDDEDND